MDTDRACVLSRDAFIKTGAKDNGRTWTNLVNHLSKFDTCYAGHCQIGDHQIEALRIGAEHTERGRAAFCGGNTITPLAQLQPLQIGDHSLVVDEKDRLAACDDDWRRHDLGIRRRFDNW